MMSKKTKQIADDCKLKEGDEYTPKQLLEIFQADKNIKIKEFEVPFESHCYLYDISLSCKGFEEDQFYAYNSAYRNFIRRGNTIFSKDDKYLIGRKGLIKFFDLRQEYIEYNLTKETEKFKSQFSQEDKELKKIIFDEVQDLMTKGFQVELFQLVKANGENCQISYIDLVDSWLISSKNVSLLAKNVEDIEKYSEQRFQFAKLIAQVWFVIINGIEKKDKNLVTELKQILNNHTIVGEYCGNPQYQHLVKYNKIDLHFYALVDKHSHRSCIPPNEVYQIFQKFDLTVVNKTLIGTFTNFVDFNKSLLELFNKVAQSNIDEDQEGSVLYIVKKSQDEYPSETLSLCKLKTLEYRIFRKLREKLKNLLNESKKQKQKSQKSSQYLFMQFQNEVKDLCKNNSTPYPLNYYFAVAQMAIGYVEQNPNNAKFVTDCYINFLSVILNCLALNIKPKPNLFTLEEVQKLSEFSWNDLAQKYLQSQQNSQQNLQQQQGEEESKMEIQYQKKDQPYQQQKTLFVLFFIGVPGMGKTFIQQAFENKCKQCNFDFYSVSSDQIRKDQMNELSKKNPNYSIDALFEKTGKSAGKAFDDEVKSIATNVKKSKSDIVFLYIDKNIVPNNIDKHLSLVTNCCPVAINLIKIAVYPLGLSTFEYKNNKYPFSLNFIMNCLTRIFNRENHQNLQGKNEKSLQISLLFLKMYRNITLNVPTLKNIGFDEVYTMPFVYEDIASNTQFTDDFVNKFENLLDSYRANEQSIDILKFKNFIEEMDKQNFQFKFVEQETIAEHIERSFTGLLKKINYQANQQQQPSSENKVQELEVEQEETKNQIQNNNQQNQVFNPQKIPTFLGIFLKDEIKETSIQDIQDYVTSGLFYLFSAFKDDIEIEEDYQSFEQRFTKPNSYHITTFFAGKKQQKTKSEFYTSFKENLEMVVGMYAFAYIPNKIITGICFLCESEESKQIQIENKYPHMTLFLGQNQSAKFSNDVLDALFRPSDGPMKKNYNQSYFDGKEFTEKHSVKIDKKQETVYVVKLGDNLLFDCITKAHF